MNEQHNDMTATEDQQIGRALNARRRLVEMPQRKLAAEMNSRGHTWDASSVSRVEKGERSLRFTEVIHLCQILDMTPNELASLDGGDAQLNRATLTLDSTIRSLEEIRYDLSKALRDCTRTDIKIKQS